VLERIYEMRRRGHTLAEIGRRTGVGWQRVGVYCRRAGVKRGGLVHDLDFYGKPMRERDRQIRAMRAGGAKLREVAAAFDLCIDRVRQICAGEAK
jgi:DNA-directed RNA polymerase sigma subunit (sigma70/sigma32)